MSMLQDLQNTSLWTATFWCICLVETRHIKSHPGGTGLAHVYNAYISILASATDADGLSDNFIELPAHSGQGSEAQSLTWSTPAEAGLSAHASSTLLFEELWADTVEHNRKHY